VSRALHRVYPSPQSSQGQPKLGLRRCDNFVEQRKHSRMAPYVIDLNQCGGAVQRLHGSECKS